MKRCMGVCLAWVGVLVAGCDNLESARRLRLPRGSAENGKVAFVALRCTECHTVVGVDLPAPTVAPERVVELGGDVPRLRTVGDLLTSIIHPTQSVSPKMKSPAEGEPAPKMPTVNDVMTVSQMVDLVRFLQPRYTEMPPPIDWNYWVGEEASLRTAPVRLTRGEPSVPDRPGTNEATSPLSRWRGL